MLIKLARSADFCTLPTSYFSFFSHRTPRSTYMCQLPCMHEFTTYNVTWAYSNPWTPFPWWATYLIILMRHCKICTRVFCYCIGSRGRSESHLDDCQAHISGKKNKNCCDALKWNFWKVGQSEPSPLPPPLPFFPFWVLLSLFFSKHTQSAQSAFPTTYYYLFFLLILIFDQGRSLGAAQHFFSWP